MVGLRGKWEGLTVGGGCCGFSGTDDAASDLVEFVDVINYEHL